MWNAIKEAVKAGLEVMSKAPVSGIIKAGIFVGVAGFTLWVMIRRTKKMHEDAQEKRYTSPVDEILGKSYATDPDVYDDMDPIAKKICKKLNRGWKSKKKRKKEAAKRAQREVRYKTVSVFDDDDFDLNADEEAEEEAPAKKSTSKKEYHFYEDANDMLMAESARRKRKKNPAKVKKAKENYRRNKAKKSSMETLAKEWKESGVADSKTAKKRLDEIARELGLPVDDIDDRISEETRKANPSLF